MIFVNDRAGESCKRGGNRRTRNREFTSLCRRRFRASYFAGTDQCDIGNGISGIDRPTCDHAACYGRLRLSCDCSSDFKPGRPISARSSCSRARRQTRLSDMDVLPCASALGHRICSCRGCGGAAACYNDIAESQSADHWTDDGSPRATGISDGHHRHSRIRRDGSLLDLAVNRQNRVGRRKADAIVGPAMRFGSSRCVLRHADFQRILTAAPWGNPSAKFFPSGLFCATLRTLRGHRHAADSSAAATLPP